MYAQVNGHAVYYDDSGTAGVPVVFLHGIAGSSNDFAQVRRLLPAQVRSIAYDARGVGKSHLDERPAAFTMADLVGDLATLLDELDISRACLAGASMGGGIAQYFTAEHGDRVAALALISTSSTFPAELRERFHADAERAVLHGMSALADEFVERWFSDWYRRTHPAEIETLKTRYRAMRSDVFAQRCRVNAERDVTGRLREFGCPVLVVAGSADPGTQPATLRTYLEEVPDCEVTVLGGRSHCLEREAPDRLASLLGDLVLCRRRL